ncbi:exopolyphosphatase [Kiloniella spongiae]|uniref:Exopolyphosphatase n=1 Tax=Kiloniella spongiae TaxID=1489064 RepID=A0A0H2MDF0_9PROT|nr:Ppx/GppA phosphatase family protein [Kiloniella spongiae]KLN60251.1 exopolyphosphatase [Kiloniella spongiae]
MTVTSQARKKNLYKKATKRTDNNVYAAIDLGTNNCRLLVARSSRKNFRVLDTFSRIVRLGEGLSQTGNLSEEAMRRTLSALKICTSKLKRRGVTKLRCVATEACRRAANGDDFIKRVKKETGLDLEIIDNSEEASLAIMGCAPLLDPDLPEALIFDIGGGSTEVSWIRQDSKESSSDTTPETASKSGMPKPIVPNPIMEDWYSVSKGVVTLAEKYGGRDISSETYEQMVQEIYDDFLIFEQKHGFAQRVRDGKLQLLGTSGTVTTLVGVYKKLPRYDRNRVDGTLINCDTAIGLCHKIAGMTYAQRVANPCIGSQRADLVVAGCAIFEALAKLWPVAQLRVADRGLREGILYKLINED